jgi:2,3-bisphosphoglycerate-independent phosphoglycerate mutase
MEKKNKKYVVLIGDGMSDEPLDSLDGKTPLEVAHTPNMDFLASNGVLGLARTVPEGIAPGSDTANLSIFGYNPRQFFTGRAPLEALNMGIALGDQDVAFRCNIVTLDHEVMKDFTAGHIDSNLSRIIIQSLAKRIIDKNITFYPGVSYRNLMVWKNFPYSKIPTATPPHDITGKEFSSYLPEGEGSDMLREIMKLSQSVMRESDEIVAGKAKYKGNPVSVWLWGGGFRPKIEPITRRFGLKGSTISAVDLIHGIGIAAGLKPCHVEGATGYLDTNYIGKAKKAMELLSDGEDIVVVHVESPDESGHEGNIEHKIQAIEDFDKFVVGEIINGLSEFEDVTLLCMPDHPTPIGIRTHSSDPVPFAIYRKKGFSVAETVLPAKSYSEKEARMTGLFIDDASVLIDALVKGAL